MGCRQTGGWRHFRRAEAPSEAFHVPIRARCPNPRSRHRCRTVTGGRTVGDRSTTPPRRVATPPAVIVLTGRIAQGLPEVSARSASPRPDQRARRYRTIAAKSSASSDAPPTSAPSMSGWAMSSAALVGLTDPPYCTRTAAAASAPATLGDRGPDERAHGLGVLGAGGAPGADGPDRLVGDDEPADRARRRRPASPARTCPVDLGLGLVGLALVERLAHAHDRRHAVRRIAFTLRFTSSSVSPNSSRRSEWPAIT